MRLADYVAGFATRLTLQVRDPRHPKFRSQVE